MEPHETTWNPAHNPEHMKDNGTVHGMFWGVWGKERCTSREKGDEKGTRDRGKAKRKRKHGEAEVKRMKPITKAVGRRRGGLEDIRVAKGG